MALFESQDRQGSNATRNFFIFICVSIAARSFEAGIVSSRMPSIASGLHLSYTEEGMVAASPDYGIVPGGVAAIGILQYMKAYNVMIIALCGTTAVTLACAMFPSKATLLAARAVGGFLWAHVATLYPVWINIYGENGSTKTFWIAGMNASLLVGILLGYIVGGITNFASFWGHITWVDLYFMEGFLLLGCTVTFLCQFDSRLLEIRDHCLPKDMKKVETMDTLKSTDECSKLIVDSIEEEIVIDGRTNIVSEYPTAVSTSDRGSSRNEYEVWDLLCMLPKSAPFIFALSLASCVVGCTSFCLYFITQVCGARGFTPSQSTLMVAAVFSTAPAPGTLVGAQLVGKDGYRDHKATFGLTLLAAIGSTLAALSFVLWKDDKIIFVFSCWSFFFVGATCNAPLSGVMVSAVPEASHVASGVQFAIVNSAKILVPQVGGVIIDQIGLVDGFNVTVAACATIFLVLAVSAYIQAHRSSKVNKSIIALIS